MANVATSFEPMNSEVGETENLPTIAISEEAVVDEPPTLEMIASLESSARDFLITHERWRAVLKEAMAILQSRVFNDSTRALKRMAPISETYQMQMKFLYEQRRVLRHVKQDIKDNLRAAEEEFNKLGAEFQAELQMTMKLGQQFISVVKRAVTRQLQTSQFYGSSGSLLNNVAPKAVTINESA